VQKKGGRSRGNRAQPRRASAKFHATVDALRNPTGFHLKPGQAHGLDGADVLVPGAPAATLIADKAYDAQERTIDHFSPAGHPAIPV
jgi:hypothetical protein